MVLPKLPALAGIDGNEAVSALMMALVLFTSITTREWGFCGVVVLWSVAAVVIFRRRRARARSIDEARRVVDALLAEGKTHLRQASHEQILAIKRGLDAAS